jgi:GPH family glycoside/pentoside/hexuronide:cation symporter
MAAQQTASQAKSARVPLWRTLFYALGNAAGLLTYNTFNGFIQYFYTDVQGLPPQWVGRGLFGFGLWNAVNDPVAGWLSDRTRTRWGRRRFYIGLLAIPTAVAFALIWLPPIDASNPSALIVYFLVIISLYDLLQTIITLNQDALFPEMYQETGERATASSVRQIIGLAVGTGVGVALTPIIYGELGWDALAVLWGGLAALLYFASLIGIYEDPAFAQQETPPWRKQMSVVLRNRTFLTVAAINFTTRFIIALLFAVLPFYADYVLRISETKFTLLLLALFIPAGASVLVWQRLIRRYGTRSTMIGSMTLAAACAVPLLFTHDVTATGVTLALLGSSVDGIVLGPDLLFAEVVDEDYAATGIRREGTYRGILGFVFRFPPAVTGLLLGEGLRIAGYNSDLEAAAQPDAVITLIRLYSSLFPLLTMLAGIALLYFYPLYGERLAEIQRRVSARRVEAGQQRVTQEARPVASGAVAPD